MKQPNSYLYPTYWMTYYGDILHGFLFETPELPDKLFIISNNQSKEFHVWEKSNPKDFDKLRALGWEFSDHRAITQLHNLDSETFSGNRMETESRVFQWAYRKMFIFGAGASAFCTFGEGNQKLKDFQWRPPLATEMFSERFDEILNNYPGAKTMLPNVAANGNNTEAVMEQCWQHIRSGYDIKELAKYVNTQFFLSELTEKFSTETEKHFHRYNLFNLFADSLSKYLSAHSQEAVSLVSFNYDTLLDNALQEHCDVKLKHIQDYVPLNKNPLFLFKPHGSWNWGWKFTDYQNNISDRIYDDLIPLGQVFGNMLGSIPDLYHRFSWGRESRHHSNRLGRFILDKQKLEVFPSNQRNKHFPALLIPLQDKDELLMPYEHQDYLEHYAMTDVEELYLIGWKGSEAIFNRLLSQNCQKLKRITIVNPDFEGVKKCLGEYLDFSKYEISHIKYFDDFVLNHLKAIFE